MQALKGIGAVSDQKGALYTAKDHRSLPIHIARVEDQQIGILFPQPVIGDEGIGAGVFVHQRSGSVFHRLAQRSQVNLPLLPHLGICQAQDGEQSQPGGGVGEDRSRYKQEQRQQRRTYRADSPAERPPAVDRAADLTGGGVAVLRVQCGTPAQNMPPPSLPGHRPQQLTEGRPQGIEICSGICLGESELLRRRIAPGPKQAGILRLIRLRFPGGIKINQPDMSVRRQQNVVRLDIPVENAMAVEELQHLTQLQKGVGQRPLRKRDCPQTGAFYILLRHTGLSLALFHRQDLRQIGVVQLP